MANILLVSFTYGQGRWIPYSSGCLISYVKRNPDIAEVCNFHEPLIYEKQFADLAFDEVDVIGFTNYTWNQSLNDKMAALAKQRNPDIKIIYGGPNVPETSHYYDSYRDDRSFVDAFVMGPGEVVFEKLLLAYISQEPLSVEGTFGHGWEGKRVERKDYQLDFPPTPYLDGIHDGLIASTPNLVAMVESNRGCPFKCSFCDWGSMTRSKVLRFDRSTLLETLEYLVKQPNVMKIHFADANFGLYKDDVDTIKYLIELKERYGRNFYVDINYAKNSNRFLTEIVNLLAIHFPQEGFKKNFRSGFQTHNPDTLKIIQRDNIHSDSFSEIGGELSNWDSTNELIMGLPGDTPETWIRSFEIERELGSYFTRAYKLQVLPNTPMAQPEYLAEHGMVIRNFKIPSDLFSMPMRDYHRHRDVSFEYKGDVTMSYEMKMMVACNTFTTDQLEDMFSMWFWYNLLSNSKLVYEDMRSSSDPFRIQYARFMSEKSHNSGLFGRIWGWHRRSFNDIFRSDTDIVDILENAQYLSRQPKYLSEIYLHREQAVDELSDLYPNISASGFKDITNMAGLYSIDAEIR